MDESEVGPLILDLDDFVDEMDAGDPGNVTEFIVDAALLTRRDPRPIPELLRELMETYRLEARSRPGWPRA